MKKKIFIYLLRNKLAFSSENGEIKSLVFSEEAVKNEELVDAEKFKSEINKFLSDNNLHNLQGPLIVGEECSFSKTLTGDNLEKQIEEFINEVPFEKNKISYKVYNQNENIIIAINNNLCTQIQKELELYNIAITSVVPDMLLPKNKAPLLKILKKSSELKKLSIQRVPEKSKERNGLVLITALLFVLIGVALITMTINSRESESAPIENRELGGLVPTDPILADTIAKSDINIVLIQSDNEEIDYENEIRNLNEMGYSKIQTEVLRDANSEENPQS
ncbi:MAG TPA: hypothetical protein PLF29_02745, partial [bacterium]|nr:hypothetical protein [bacterium]